MRAVRLATAGVVLGLLLAAVTLLVEAGMLMPVQLASADQPVAIDYAAMAVVDEHAADCWGRGDVPLAELPGAAIVEWVGGPRDGEVVYSSKPGVVSAAFGEALYRAGLEGEGVVESARLDVVQLCR